MEEKRIGPPTPLQLRWSRSQKEPPLQSSTRRGPPPWSAPAWRSPLRSPSRDLCPQPEPCSSSMAPRRSAVPGGRATGPQLTLPVLWPPARIPYTAAYSGDSNYGASTSASLLETITSTTKATASITLTSSSPSVAINTNVTFYAALQCCPGFPGSRWHSAVLRRRRSLGKSSARRR